MPKEAIKGFSVDEVLRGYIDAALWSSNDESTPSGGEPFDRNYSASDLADEAREIMRSDVREFLSKASETDLDSYRELRTINRSEGTIGDYLGHDFWLSRNGHGAGFFTRDELGDLGERLQDFAGEFGERWIYLGDDGEIYVQ